MKKLDICFHELKAENVSVRFGLVPSPPSEYERDILIIKYEGNYPLGSAGKSDAKYMYAMGIAGISRYSPRSIVVDLSDLKYEWGDDLESVFDLSVGKDFTNTVFVVSDNCAEAIGTLLEGFDNPESKLLARSYFYDDINEAISYLINEKLSNKYSNLIQAIEDDDYDSVVNELKNGIDLNSRSGIGGFVPLCSAKSLRMVKLLLESGADPFIESGLFDTLPIHQQKNVEIVKLYLDLGVDADSRSSVNQSPLDWCDSVERAKLLIDAGADVQKADRDSLIHEHKVLCNPDLLELYVSRGINVNQKNRHSKTPLDVLDSELGGACTPALVRSREILITNGAFKTEI